MYRNTVEQMPFNDNGVHPQLFPNKDNLVQKSPQLGENSNTFLVNKVMHVHIQHIIHACARLVSDKAYIGRFEFLHRHGQNVTLSCTYMPS